jgi:type II secretory pathway pseudopilin PulG
MQKGFTYLTVLFVLAMMSGGLALIGEVWHTSNVREKEADLLHIGNEYRKAIQRYYLYQNRRQYPKSLADLVKDSREPGTLRHLRRVYPDPITGSEEWGLVKSADGGIAGVHSLSEAAPLKTGGFAVRDASFEGKSKYAEWQFIYAVAPPPGAKPGAASTKPGAAPASGAPTPPAGQSDQSSSSSSSSPRR